MSESVAVVVPWHRREEIEEFLQRWHVAVLPPWLILQQDATRAGCGATKNAGIKAAVAGGADVVVIVDGDCYPTEDVTTLEQLVEAHRAALEPQPVRRFRQTTHPPARGTPYGDGSMQMPVAASMGHWQHVADYCAVRQLAFNAGPMTYYRGTVFGEYFPLCGMNLAFRPREWWPWCQFIDVSRFDDIWMGWLWQREAYRRGFCFNLNGPDIYHSRQSNVWKNLIDEAKHLEANEVLWSRIACHESSAYADLLTLLPEGGERLSVHPFDETDHHR